MEKQNYRVREASLYLAVAVSTVWLYAKQGKITPIKLSARVTIFKKEDLDRFIHINSFSKSFGNEVDKISCVTAKTKKDNICCTNLETIDAKMIER